MQCEDRQLLGDALAPLGDTADMWRRLDELAPLGDAVDAVLRTPGLPLHAKLPRTPAQWQPAVIRSHAADGALTLFDEEAVACSGAMHAVSGVHSLTLDVTDRDVCSGRGYAANVAQEPIQSSVHCQHCRPCLLYTSPSPRDRTRSRMPSSA